MATKEPVLLTVLIETGQFRWYVAGITLDGCASPLICSEAGNLSPCLGVLLDEQVNFLRHRLSGVLQRGCDRLWGRQQKPCQIVFVTDGSFAGADSDLNCRVAEHFVAWMGNPPVVFFVIPAGFLSSTPLRLELLAGELEPARRRALEVGLPQLFAAVRQPEAWELARSKREGGSFGT